MATGDQTDIASRVRQLIPHGWFANSGLPLNDALVQGAAACLTLAYSLLAYVRLQTRIATATDGFLDMLAGDFFGQSLTRAQNQSDASFRSRIIINLIRERVTRAGIIGVLQQLTGRTPMVFEPMRPADTGGYRIACGYGVAGGYGSMLLPTQSFVTAFRPTGTGIPNVAGYGISTFGYGVASQGEYASLAMSTGSITDADIYAAIDSVRAAGYTIYARIKS